MKIRDRVKETITVSISKIRDNPWNWRTHDDKQKEALGGILQEIGFAGALLTRPLDDGTYMLIDGHARKAELIAKGVKKVRIHVTDLTEEEAKILLAAHDPVGAMAGKDTKKLRELLKDVEVDNQPLASLFSDLLGKAKSGDLDLNLDADSSNGKAPEVNPEELPVSTVRMIQLFCNIETAKQVEVYVATLSKEYGTDSLTDTVVTCLKKAYKALTKKQPV